MPSTGLGRRACRRTRTLALSLLLAVTLATASASVPAVANASARLDAVERRIIRLINHERARLGMRRLRPVWSLARAADFHSRNMLRGRFFAHASRNGTPAARRVGRFRRAMRFGETLAYLSRVGIRAQASQVVAMWMASPGHRAVLLTPGFRRIGVGRRTGLLASGPGTVFTADLQSRR
jgi:uncharacterized protein YkwD